MQEGIPLFPARASTIAEGVDHLYFFLVAITLLFTALIFLCVFYFALRYRRRNADYLPQPVEGSMALEAIWIVVPFVLSMIMFVWGGVLYVRNSVPPPGSLEIYVVGKQWMWKLQHPEGQREINELHVPVGQPVKLIMTSQDVIHSFYVPAFRVKQDVIPGRYATMWFQPTRAGSYHLFCAEYCGNQHSGMIGKVIVMEPADYQQWLSGAAAGETMISAGENLLERLACVNCHKPVGGGRGPSLRGVFGKPVRLQTGETIIADEAYIRESILNPAAKITAGYPNIMPTFKGLISEEDLMQIVAYIKSLGTGEEAR